MEDDIPYEGRYPLPAAYDSILLIVCIIILDDEPPKPPMVAFEPNLIAGRLKPERAPDEEEEEEEDEDDPSLDPRRIAGNEKGNDGDDGADAMEGDDDEADAAKLA